jgi:putative transposase
MMSQTNSPSVGCPYGLKRVCRVWEVSRSTYYSKKKMPIGAEGNERRKPGPKPTITDGELLGLIKEDLATSPFKGEGHRKVHSRLKRKNARVSKNRVLEVMKENSLLSPHRGKQASQNPHDGTIITDKPNVMWCSDETKILTVDEIFENVPTVPNYICLSNQICPALISNEVVLDRSHSISNLST